jgi:3',5'-cyclic AMP phosphodiesterase CpdA
MADDTGRPEQLVARFPRPTAERRTSVAVVGDPHVSVTRTVEGKPVAAEAYLRRAVADIETRDVDGVVSIGDLTDNGLVGSFERVDDLLDGLAAPFVSIPGNHDVRDSPPDVDRESLPQAAFERRYSEGSVPFVHRVGPIEFVGLDSIQLLETLDGRDATSQTEWLAETLPGLDDPVVVLHHPLPGMTDWLAGYGAHIDDLEALRLWEDPDPLLDVLADHGVPLALSGHLHIPGYASTRGVEEVMAPSLSSFPQAYLRLEVTPGGTDVFLVPVASHEETETDFVRRYTATTRNRVYASAGAAFLAGPPVDTR